MPKPRTRRFTSTRRAVTFGTAALLLASFLTYQWVAKDISGGHDVAAAKPQSFKPAPKNTTPLPADGGTWTGPVGATWPAAGAVNLTLTSAKGPVTGKAGGVPIALSAKPGRPAPAKVTATVLPQQHSEKLGVSGPVITLDGDPGEIDATIDYAGFQQLFGGGWADRLTLRQLPPCAAITPELTECQQTTPVDVVKPFDGARISAAAKLGPALTVFAVSADTESEEGDYKASDLKASGSWTAGDSSGGFSYSNPIRVPEVHGPSPDVALAYSSQTVDGRMAGNNNQSSWAGDGWDYSPGLIERSYVSCADDQDKDNGKEPNNKEKDKKSYYDQCWKGDSPNITVAMAGSNTSLVKDDKTGAWRAQRDPNWKIEHIGLPASKSAGTSERWVITTPDGTRHYFASEVDASKSRWTVPVFGNHEGEDCHAAKFKDSSCDQAWRWLLDKVVDVHGNMTRYRYQNESGHYGAADDKKNRVSFIRGGHLTRIDYGLHTDHPNVAATGRITFDTADRCDKDCWKDGKPVGKNWPDVPWDQECAAEPCTDKTAPVFFSTQRLTKITTQIRRGNDYAPVESWTLKQEFKEPKDKRRASLWLKEIVHAGHVGGTVTEPPVQFTGVELANRVNALPGAPLFSRWRIQNIRTESGADIHVSYSDPDCDTHDLPKPETNTRLCYPVYWTPDGYFEPRMDWFRKYRVTEVRQSDRTANQPSITTRYDYSTEGSNAAVLWAWDDSEFTKKKHRTYGQWRGYARVTTTIGEPGTQGLLRTRKQYFRGLDDQPLPNNQSRDVHVVDSAGTAHADHPALAGTVLEEANLDGDTVVEARTATYWIKETAARTRTGGTDRAYKIGPAVQTTRKLLAPDVWSRTEQRTGYNDEGLPVAVSDLGDVHKAGDETCKTTTYVGNTNPYLRGIVSRVETAARACGESINRPDDVISDVKTFHDNSDAHGSTPSKGLATREDVLDRWQTGPVYTTTAKNSFDSLGRAVAKTDALGAVTRTTYTPEGPGPVTRTTTVNALDHQSITDQDPAFATPVTIEDANGKKTHLRHDPLGRLTKVWLPGRTDTQTPNMEFGYLIRADGPIVVNTKRLGPNAAQKTEIGLFDSLYRSVQTQEDAPDGTRLVISTGYNDKGQKAYGSQENHAIGSPTDQLLEIQPGKDRNRTVSTYDALGRVVDESVWSYNKRLWGTATAYGGNKDGWQVTVTPPQGGTATSSVYDVRARMTELRQHHGAKPEGQYDSTRYTHTPRGDLATVTNGMGRTWIYRYDLRGREIKTVDPDKGTTTVTYNNADDVTSSTDATGATVSTEYDLLGRQTKRHHNGTLAAEWTYDTATSSPPNAPARVVAKGHPAKSTSFIDGHAFTRETIRYTDSYQVAEEETVIPPLTGLEKVAGKFITATAYNVDGTPKRKTLPRVGSMNREILDHAYDDFGNVIRLIGTSYPSGTVNVYVDETKYSPYGELNKRVLGRKDSPQSQQTYIYDDVTRRLAEFYFDRDATIPNVAALKYTYDDAGNVLSMANQPTDRDEKPRAGESDVQCFGYDYLRRLTTAWSQESPTCATKPSTDTIGGKAPYGLTYEFDKAGSRTKVTDHRASTTTTYTYRDAQDAKQPHAVRTATTGDNVNHYDWDAGGNLKYRKIGDRSETLEWTPQGKLAAIQGPEGQTRMLYDVDGNRIARIDPNGTATAFIANHEYVASKTGLSTTRYYQHAGDTIASRTDTSTQVGDIIWLGSDQHDSVAWAVNSTTRVATTKRQDPYGNKRGNDSESWPSGRRGFVGGIEDPSGLTILGMRYYDPQLGSFISVDPKTDEYDPQRLHPYAYANNNPVTFADPDGLFWGWVKSAVNKVASAATSTAKWVVNNAATISTVAGAIATVAAFLPPPGQVIAAAAGAVSTVAGAIDTGKSCIEGAAMDCAAGIASMVPGVRQARAAERGAGAAKNGAKGAEPQAPTPRATSCPLPNSFLPGTRVLMADGGDKAIEQIKKDDEVPAADPEKLREGSRPVTHLITRSGNKTLIEIGVDVNGDGKKDGALTATNNHPFWLADQAKWARADLLVNGNQLLTRDGAKVSIVTVRTYEAVTTVHNLHVDDLETYYVQVGGVHVLVHNMRPEGDAPQPPPNVGTHSQLAPAGPGKERHHIPPHSTRPDGSSYGKGPAIRMDKDDHRALYSTGRTKTGESEAWRFRQQQLVAAGRHAEAMEMEYEDIQRRFPGKYDAEIAEHRTKYAGGPTCP